MLDAVPGLTNDHGHCLCGEGVGLEVTILISPYSQASMPTLELVSHLELVADVLAHVATMPPAPAAHPARAATEPVLVNKGGTARGLTYGGGFPKVCLRERKFLRRVPCRSHDWDGSLLH